MLDTIAMVYLKMGEMTLAKEYMDRALNCIGRGDYSELEVRLNAAELLFRSGFKSEAAKSAARVRADPNCSRLIRSQAPLLMLQIDGGNE